jgi:hypothetical protein
LCGGVRLLPNCCSKVGGPYKYLFNVKLFWATSKDHVPPYHCFCCTFSLHLLTNGWTKHLQTMCHLGISLHSISITSLHINSLTFCLAWSTLFPHPGYWTTTCGNSKSKYWYQHNPTRTHTQWPTQSSPRPWSSIWTQSTWVI